MPMSNNLKARLLDRNGIVDNILHEHSGGCKMTTLITEIITILHTGHHTDVDEFDPEEFDKALSASSLFGILEYSWDISGKGVGPFRSKSFVYRKPV